MTTDEKTPQADGQRDTAAQHADPSSGQDQLASTLADLARSLQQEKDPTAVLQGIVRAAINLVPGAEEGSNSVVTGRRHADSRVPSSDLPQQVDALQVETGEGPCLDAVYEHKTVRVPDLRTEQRWPEFARRACEAGVGSMLSFQLYVEGDDLGALNLYSRQPNAFSDESEHVGLPFAAHAAVAFAAVEKQGQLHRAMETRDLIGQAKGILMERFKINDDHAFRLLTQASQNMNRKLRDVADELVHHGELDGQYR